MSNADSRILFSFTQMIHTMGDDAIDLMLNVHNAAPLRLIRECAPYFRNKDPNNKAPRTIVNVSSTSGLHGNVGQANYAIAKAGVVGLTKTVAKEWGAFGVRCNTVAYGWITTRLTGAKELGETIIVRAFQISSFSIRPILSARRRQCRVGPSPTSLKCSRN